MMQFTPAEFAKTVYHGKVTAQTVRNWIKRRTLPKGCRVEYTPTNRAIIIMDEKPQSNAVRLVQMMESKYRGTQAA